MPTTKIKRNRENIKNIYGITGEFFYPSSGNARIHPPFSGHFAHSPYLDNILEGEMLDRYGVSYISGNLDLSKKKLDFNKYYGGSKGMVEYHFRKNGALWEGSYNLEGKQKDNAICKIFPLSKGDVRHLVLSYPAEEIYRELLRKASKSK